MYSRSTNSINVTTALLVGTVVVLFVVIIKPLLTTFSIPIVYPGSWWKFQTSASELYTTRIYKMPDILLPEMLVIQSKQELFVGKKIYTPDHEFLGSVVAVKKFGTGYYGWTRLLSSNPEKVLVSFLVEDVVTHVEARGRGQGIFVAQLPGVVKVKEGTVVTLSGTGQNLGIVVGTRSNQQDPFQRIFISPKNQLRSLPGLLVE